MCVGRVTILYTIHCNEDVVAFTRWNRWICVVIWSFCSPWHSVYFLSRLSLAMQHIHWQSLGTRIACCRNLGTCALRWPPSGWGKCCLTHLKLLEFIRTHFASISIAPKLIQWQSEQHINSSPVKFTEPNKNNTVLFGLIITVNIAIISLYVFHAALATHTAAFFVV